MTTEKRYTVRHNDDGTHTVTRNGSDVYVDTSASFAARVCRAMNASLDESGPDADPVTQAEPVTPDAGLAAPAPTAWATWRPILAFFIACGAGGFLLAVLVVHWFGDLIAKLLGGA